MSSQRLRSDAFYNWRFNRAGERQLTDDITACEAICAHAKFNMTAETINLRDRAVAGRGSRAIAFDVSARPPAGGWNWPR
jgi:hypothetical protein